MEKEFLDAGDICFLFLKVQEERTTALKSFNTHNAPGRNIPCDLHQEHLNRIVKDDIYLED